MKKIISTIILFTLVVMNVFSHTSVLAANTTQSEQEELTVQELLKEESPKTETPKEEPTKQETPTPSVTQKVIPKTGESDILHNLLAVSVVLVLASGVRLIYYKRCEK